MVRVRERSDAYPNELSGGARQKVALARAIASEPSVLLLDEPLGSLDASVRSGLRLELRRLAKELRLTTIHVTHDQEEAMSISDRLVIMRGGRVVEVGKPQDLYLNPKELFTANFLGEANFMTGIAIGSTEEGVKLDVQGEQLTILPRAIPTKAIIAIRPQFIQISRRRTKVQGGWEGTVTERTFLGEAVRFELNLDNGLRITARVPLTVRDVDADVGDEIIANFQKDKILTFAYPSEGLEKELSG
jgi:ABC-type Fe3+/spermidine/putrescine transport system ATPase subunit